MIVRISINNVEYQSLSAFIGGIAGRIGLMINRQKIYSGLVALMNRLEKPLGAKIQSICQEKGVDIHLNGLRAELIEAETISLSFDIDEIDLVAIGNLLLPTVQKHIESDARLSFLAEPMASHPEALLSALTVLCDQLSKDEKDKLMTSAVNAYHDKIIAAIEAFAKEKGLMFNVVSLIAE